jgi:hypothetical protein
MDCNNLFSNKVQLHIQPHNEKNMIPKTHTSVEMQNISYEEAKLADFSQTTPQIDIERKHQNDRLT